MIRKLLSFFTKKEINIAIFIFILVVIGAGLEVFSLSLFANNLLDEVARNHTSFVKNEIPLAGRNYGIRFNYQF